SGSAGASATTSTASPRASRRASSSACAPAKRHSTSSCASIRPTRSTTTATAASSRTCSASSSADGPPLMDFVGFDLRVDMRQVRVDVVEAAGPRSVVLDGEAFLRVVKAARPLLAELSRRAGPVYALAVDSLKRRALAAGAEGAVTVGHDEYDGIVDAVGEL